MSHGGKRRAEEDATGPSAKRAAPDAAAGAAAAATAGASDPFPGYTLDSASGWYLNNENPAWQYNPTTSIFYNASDTTFYRQDPATMEFAAVKYPLQVGAEAAAAAAGTGGGKPPVGGLGTQPLIAHRADHTFMQGRRPTQEDRHTMVADYGARLGALGLNASFYAVFDGHTGEQCSEFVAKTLHVDLAKELKAVGNPLDEEAVKKCISRACAKTEKEFLRIAKIRKRRDGCCCIAVLLLGRTMFVINIGDSRAVLVHRGKAIRVSDDHKPERPDEKARIERAGGHVLKYGSTWRVTSNEALAWEKKKFKQNASRPVQPAVARSFGDSTLKAPQPLLTCEPEITVHELGEGHSLLLLGCDGIWDVLSDQVAADTAASVSDGPKAMAGAVVKLAYDRGSTDNISAVVICINDAPHAPK